MKWSDLVASAFNKYIKNNVVAFIVKAAGITSKFWVSVASFILSKVYLAIKEKIEEQARLMDQAKKDRELLAEYKKAIQEKRSEQELIAIEEEILNGGRK